MTQQGRSASIDYKVLVYSLLKLCYQEWISTLPYEAANHLCRLLVTGDYMNFFTILTMARLAFSRLPICVQIQTANNMVK